MTVVPTLDAKPAAETTAGELIHFPVRGKMILGIVAGCDSLELPFEKVIVLLENMPERPGTQLRFMPVTDYLVTALCLSYGTAHRLVVTSVRAIGIDERRRIWNEWGFAGRRRKEGRPQSCGGR